MIFETSNGVKMLKVGQYNWQIEPRALDPQDKEEQLEIYTSETLFVYVPNESELSIIGMREDSFKIKLRIHTIVEATAVFKQYVEANDVDLSGTIYIN